MYRGPDLNRHGPCGPWDFKSHASTNSATPAKTSRLARRLSPRPCVGACHDLCCAATMDKYSSYEGELQGGTGNAMGDRRLGERSSTGSQNGLRRRPDSNRRIKVLQTSPLPLGYVAIPHGHPDPSEKRPRHLVGWGRRGICNMRNRKMSARCDYRAPTSRCPGTERETGFEPATSTLARLRSTN
jgi:hypothetical protein